jgi:hypothetical protein
MAKDPTEPIIKEDKKAGIKTETKVVNYGAPETEEKEIEEKPKKNVAKDIAALPNTYKPQFPTLETAVTKEYLSKMAEKSSQVEADIAKQTFEQEHQIWQMKKGVVLNEIKKIQDKYGPNPNPRFLPFQAVQWKALHEELERIEGLIDDLRQKYANVLLFGTPSLPK